MPKWARIHWAHTSFPVREPIQLFIQCKREENSNFVQNQQMLMMISLQTQFYLVFNSFMYQFTYGQEKQ